MSETLCLNCRKPKSEHSNTAYGHGWELRWHCPAACYRTGFAPYEYFRDKPHPVKLRHPYSTDCPCCRRHIHIETVDQDRYLRSTIARLTPPTRHPAPEYEI